MPRGTPVRPTAAPCACFRMPLLVHQKTLTRTVRPADQTFLVQTRGSVHQPRRTAHSRIRQQPRDRALYPAIARKYRYRQHPLPGQRTKQAPGSSRRCRIPNRGQIRLSQVLPRGSAALRPQRTGGPAIVGSRPISGRSGTSSRPPRQHLEFQSPPNLPQACPFKLVNRPAQPSQQGSVGQVSNVRPSRAGPGHSRRSRSWSSARPCRRYPS
mgnify:CR=1 FL=1